MAAQKKYPDELRERAVKMVLEIRERDGRGQGELARVARQLGVRPEARRPAAFSGSRSRTTCACAPGRNRDASLWPLRNDRRREQGEGGMRRRGSRRSPVRLAAQPA